MSPLETIEIKNIDHLGIVAGIIDEIGIVEVINEREEVIKKRIIIIIEREINLENIGLI